MSELVRIDLKNNTKLQTVTIDQIKQSLSELNIRYISLKGEKIIRWEDEIVWSEEYTNIDNPLVIEKDSFIGDNVLNINPEWYAKNYQLVDSMMQYIARHTQEKSITFNHQAFITDALVDELCKNENLQELAITPYAQSDIYQLTKEHYEKLKKSSIKKVTTQTVVAELQDNFDPLIDCNYNKKIIGFTRYKDLETEKRIYVDNLPSQEELENLKYLSPHHELYISDYNILPSVLERLNELGYANQIAVHIDDKEQFNDYLMKYDITPSHVSINWNNMTIPIQEYKRLETKLYTMIQGISHLSPFEQYIYIYNITKQFKKYKENEEDRNSSRKLYQILENEFMVCVGFSALLGDLLTKAGISNSDLSIAVDTSYDKAYKGKEPATGINKPTQSSGHARRCVRIIDQKYGIDGIYISDPTWDNDLENDYYNHLALTPEETENAKRYLFLSPEIELLNIHSLEEFYQKIQFLTKGENSRKELVKIIYHLIHDLLAKLDPTLVSELSSKYPYITKLYILDSHSCPADFSNLIQDLGTYILNHTNKEISGNTIMTAVENVYRNAYGYREEQIHIMMPYLIEKNKERQSNSFPLRYRIDKDGNKEIYMNETNKFDIENQTKMR